MSNDIERYIVKINDQEAADRWRQHFGIHEIYLSDIAAGALIEVQDKWTKDDAPDHVARGLRRLLQELWHLDLARPVLGVFWPWPGPEPMREVIEALERLTWDQDAHRGDFALRGASDQEAARKLLLTLMGDTMESLDDSALSHKVTIPTVIQAFSMDHEDETTALARLSRSILAELERARDTSTRPDLVAVLDRWLHDEGVLP